MYAFPGITVGEKIWISIPNNYDQANSKLDCSLVYASITLSIITNAITTMMIAYKLWYVVVGVIHRIQWLTMN